MINNKSKDNIIKSHPINAQKIKNLIHLNDLKKLKKYSIVNITTSNDYIFNQTKLIMKKLANKYNRGSEFYYKKIITDIIDNESSHLVAVFKEYLIYGDYSEFLQGYFHLKEIIKFLPLIFEYYDSSTVIFPNYVILEEKKYIYKNIQKKQKIINIQQEQEEIDKKKRNKKLEKQKNNDDFFNLESDSQSKSDVLTPHVLNSILNQTNTSNNRKLFGINKNNNNTNNELDEFIEKLKNEENKITLKNKNQKNRNRHIIAIHKGNNNIKKDNNKSNNTNTYNTISTKNNTKGKEKSNLDTKSFSDKNIKNNYNLSSINLNYSKNINKNFLLRLGRIKANNEMKTTRNILLEIPGLNTSRKFKKINFAKNYEKSQILTEFNKSKNTKISKLSHKKINEKETVQIKNYNLKHIKRIKSCYGINPTNSRNKNIFCEGTLLSNNSSNSNKYKSKNGNTMLKICSTLNNINNESNLLSLDIDKRQKKLIPKKNNPKLDSKIINVIYSKRLDFNYSSKNCMNDIKKLFKNKINKHKLNIPKDKQIYSTKKHKNSHSKYIASFNNSKINPFEQKISPPHTNRNQNKKIIKHALLSPYNINCKFSTSRIIVKKQLDKNSQLNNKKIQIKKDIKKILKENKSNKIIKKKKDITDAKQLNINEFLTINVNRNHKRSPNPGEMKKRFESSITQSVNNTHYRVKTLYNNRLPDNYIKYKK